MPPRPAPYDALRAALVAQWDLLAGALEAADPAAPTACRGWAVRELAAHLAATAASLAAVAAAPAPTGPAVGLDAWVRALPALAGSIDAGAHQEQPAFREAVATARAAVDGAPPDRLVQQRTGVHRLSDAVLFRLVEAVLHGLDLPEPLAPDRKAAAPVVRALTGLLAERAPGRTVELRVPPHAAVQCVQGPRHTRGTPPNVVEADPVAFLLLAGGRLAWDDALRDGRVRASGERAAVVADLLPLL